MQEVIRSFLDKPLFKDVSKTVRAQLSKQIEQITVPADTILYLHGDSPERLFYLVKGEVLETVEERASVGRVFQPNTPRGTFKSKIGKVNAFLKLGKYSSNSSNASQEVATPRTPRTPKDKKKANLTGDANGKPSRLSDEKSSKGSSFKQTSPLSAPLVDRLKCVGQNQGSNPSQAANSVLLSLASHKSSGHRSSLDAEAEKASKSSFGEKFSGFNARLNQLANEREVAAVRKSNPKFQKQVSIGTNASTGEPDMGGAPQQPLRRRGTAKRLSATEKEMLGYKFVPKDDPDSPRFGDHQLFETIKEEKNEDVMEKSGQSSERGSNADSTSKECIVRPGECLGHECFFNKERHKSSAATLSECEILVITRASFEALVLTEQVLKQEERVKFLKRLLPSLSELSQPNFAKFIGQTHDERKSRGAVLCLEGGERESSESDGLKVILEGQARVVKGGIWAAKAKQLDGALGVHESAMKPLSMRGGHAGVAIETLLPGQIVNGSSQLLGEAEPFSVVVDSAEMVVLSISHVEMLNKMHPFLFENLRRMLEAQRLWRQQRLALLEAAPSLDLAMFEKPASRMPGLRDSPFLRFKKGLMKQGELSASICEYFRTWIPPELKSKGQTSEMSRTWGSNSYHHLRLGAPLIPHLDTAVYNEGESTSEASVDPGRSPTPTPQATILDHAASIRGRARNGDLLYQGPPPSAEQAIKMWRSASPPELEEQEVCDKPWLSAPVQEIVEPVTKDAIRGSCESVKAFEAIMPLEKPATKNEETTPSSSFKDNKKSRASFSGAGRLCDFWNEKLLENDPVAPQDSTAAATSSALLCSSSTASSPKLSKRRGNTSLSVQRSTAESQPPPVSRGSTLLSLPPLRKLCETSSSFGSEFRSTKGTMRGFGSEEAELESPKKLPDVAEAIWWPPGTPLQQSSLGGSCMGPHWEGASVSALEADQGVAGSLRSPVLEQRGDRGLILYVDSKDPFLITSPQPKTPVTPRVPETPRLATTRKHVSRTAPQVSTPQKTQGPPKLLPIVQGTPSARHATPSKSYSACVANKVQPLSFEEMAGIFKTMESKTLPPVVAPETEASTPHVNVWEQMCLMMKSLDSALVLSGSLPFPDPDVKR